MRPKARSILRDRQGLSMILVLCIGAVFVSLSAALVYAASVLTANANRQLLEQEVYQLATGFSDVLGEELNDATSSFAKFVNNTYMTSEFYGNDPFEQEAPKPTTFDATLSADGSDGADEIHVTLRRRPGEEADKLNLNSSVVGLSISSGDDQWHTVLSNWENDSYKLVDMQLDVTVTVKKDGESFSYTATYDRAVHYDVSYYTLDSATTHYTWSNDNPNTFNPPAGGDTVTIIPGSEAKRIVPHFNTNSPEGITYTRGVKQRTTTTQE